MLGGEAKPKKPVKYFWSVEAVAPEHAKPFFWSGVGADAALLVAVLITICTPTTFEGMMIPGHPTTVAGPTAAGHLFWGHMLAPVFSVFWPGPPLGSPAFDG